MQSELFEMRYQAAIAALYLTLAIVVGIMVLNLFYYFNLGEDKFLIVSFIEFMVFIISGGTLLKLKKDRTIFDKIVIPMFITLTTVPFITMSLKTFSFAFIWYFPTIIAAYIIGGLKVGRLVTFLSIAFFLIATNNQLNLDIQIRASIALLASALFGAIATQKLESLDKKYQNLIKDLTSLAYSDYLTQIPNRRFFMEEAKKLFSFAARKKLPAAILILDIDHFKNINDTYGHDKGDEILKKISKKIKESLRPSDIFARIGGEEFAILIIDESFENVLNIANRILSNIRKTSNLPTVSIGIAYFKDASTIEFEKLQQLGDQALYEAKRSGRDRLVVHKESRF